MGKGRQRRTRQPAEVVRVFGRTVPDVPTLHWYRSVAVDEPAMSQPTPKPRVSAQEFIDRVVASGLLDRDELTRALDGLEPTDRGRKVALHLVETGKLTRFQAQQLMGGRTEGFTLGQYRVLDRKSTRLNSS